MTLDPDAAGSGAELHMTMPVRPRRSALYMPGSNPRALEKAKELDADVLILDLEDAVAPDAKDEARQRVVTAVGAGGFGRREVVIRVNGLGTAWGHADLIAAAGAGADAILLPKVESADRVRQAESVLEGAGAPDELGLWCMMETPRGMLRAEEIGGACGRLRALVMGTSDLAKELHALHTSLRLPMITALGLALLSARAFGLAILDGVHLDLGDEDGFRAVCRQGRELGFDGKTLIHPKQIAVANEVFAPTPDETARAGRIIAAHEVAVREGRGVVLVDGRLVESLHVEEAKRIVGLAQAIGAAPGPSPD